MYFKTAAGGKPKMPHRVTIVLKDKLFQTKCVDLYATALVLSLDNFLSIRLTISIGDLSSSNGGSKSNYTKYTNEKTIMT